MLNEGVFLLPQSYMEVALTMAGIDTYTKLCLHLDEDPNFLDSSDSNHTITKVENADRSAAQSKFDGYSAYFDGTGDYLYLNDSEDWNLGSGDFTIDFWLRFVDKAVTCILWEQMESGTIQQQFYWVSNSYLTFVAYDTSKIAEYVWPWTTNSNDTWYHIALVRNGTSLKLYVDGSEISPSGSPTTINSKTLPNVNEALVIGARDGGAISLSGYIDEFRWSTGIARWTEGFTPPTEAYSQTIKISGVKSETTRVLVLDESDWSIESNTVVSGSGAYEVETSDTGNRTVLGRTNSGWTIGFGNITPIEE